MSEIKRIWEHCLEDWAIRMVASCLGDELDRRGYLSPKDRPYAMAIFKAIEHRPDVFRRRGYSIDGIRFPKHSYNRGKLVGVVADFNGKTPTDKDIEQYIL